MTVDSDQDLLASRARLPQHVVHRAFVAETVVLNLRTGKYHGLNPSAGRMLDSIVAADAVGEVIPELASEYGVDPERIQADLIDLCRGLLDRDLIELAPPEGRSADAGAA